MEEEHPDFGYIFLEFEPNIAKKEKRRIAEDIVRLGIEYIPAVEFAKRRFTYKSNKYDAAVRFKTPNERITNNILSEIRKMKGIKGRSLRIKNMNRIQSFIRFYDLRSTAVR